MRHGEASYAAPTDPQRPLTERGIAESVAMAKHYGDAWHQLDLVLVSPYLRAQQTWQAIEQALGLKVKVETLEELVPESDPALARDLLLASAEVAGARGVLVVAHMPLLGYLLAELVSGSEPAMFMTSGVAHIRSEQRADLIELRGPTH
ncbi:phosphohistidine phosphatase, SixA [Ferrimonas marina]|uniref:Phosphohistidine phosphatase, SixA n=2 Tax=Ferrimonas marina TaxID=299255 RepID=A0A1M5YAD1_9GAMM|nr:phosphohistidine phosphatase, SixA [Ferrimonas marina]